MKQAAALFLITLFSFNLVGYRFLFDCLQQVQQTKTSHLLDMDEYEESQLTLLKVPVNMPYQSDWPAYERFRGSLKIDGHVYQYVKRKVANDTLYLLCIPDLASQKIEIAKRDYVRLLYDLLPGNTGHPDHNKAPVHKNFQSDFDDYTYSLSLINPDASDEPFPNPATPVLCASFDLSPWQPPDSRLS